MIKFLGFKYLSLFLNGCRSLALAKILGPAEFGVYGSLIAAQQYLSYFGLGVRESIVVSLARGCEEKSLKFAISSSGVAWSFVVGIVLFSVGIYLAILKVLDYNWFLVIVIGILSILNEILINIARSFDLLKAIGQLEALYNFAPFICILIFLDKTNIRLVLESLVIGLFFSVSGYFILLKPWQNWTPSIKVIAKLVTLGVPLAINSAVFLSFNSIYIIFANYGLNLGFAGKICLALNICSFLFYSLNSYGWAKTTLSMASQAKPNEATNTNKSTNRIDNLFRFGIILLSIVASCISWPLVHLLPEYKESGKFLVLFVLLQSYNFINFNKLNKLMINNKTYKIISCYILLLITLSILWFSKIITDLKNIIYCAIILNFLITIYLNFTRDEIKNNIRKSKVNFSKVFFVYPIVAASGFMFFGEVWVFAISFCMVFCLYQNVFKKII